MSSTNFNMRLDKTLKEQAFPVLESYGLSPAQAFKLFLKQVADTRTVPLSFNYQANRLPNLATQNILEQAKAEFGTSGRYKSVDEAIRAMQELADE